MVVSIADTNHGPAIGQLSLFPSRLKGFATLLLTLGLLALLTLVTPSAEEMDIWFFWPFFNVWLYWPVRVLILLACLLWMYEIVVQPPRMIVDSGGLSIRRPHETLLRRYEWEEIKSLKVWTFSNRGYTAYRIHVALNDPLAYKFNWFERLTYKLVSYDFTEGASLNGCTVKPKKILNEMIPFVPSSVTLINFPAT